jgi:hypothetical protein
MASISVCSQAVGEVETLESQASESSVALCDVCKSMFSTLDGLKALVSKSGYEYLSFNEITNIKRGCSLCKLLKEGAFAHSPGDEKIRLRAEPLALGTNAMDDICTSYPYEILSACYLSMIKEHWTEPRRKILTLRKIPG